MHRGFIEIVTVMMDRPEGECIKLWLSKGTIIHCRIGDDGLSIYDMYHPDFVAPEGSYYNIILSNHDTENTRHLCVHMLQRELGYEAVHIYNTDEYSCEYQLEG